MKYLNLLFIIVFFINFYTMFLKHIHIYQLNHYKKEIQLNWIEKNMKNILLNSLFYITSLVFMYIPVYGIILSIIIYLILVVMNFPKKAKKPLVYTNRIIRMITISVILNIMFAYISILIYDSFLLMPFISMIIPYYLFLIDIINEPINKLINKKYINEARRILEDMPNLTIIGVTGSFGKTSMKTFLGELLSIKYSTLITPKNYNTLLGITITVREYLKSTHEIFVCEMGATQKGDIKKMCELVNPNHAVITSIGAQHLESFHTINNVVSTKFELVDSIKNGKIFLNYDNEYIRKKKINKKYITYGINYKGSDFSAYGIKATNEGLTFKMKDEKSKEVVFTTKLIGEHNVLNLVGAIGIASSFGISIKSMVKVVRNLEPVKHRLQLIPGNMKSIIDDAYNSNPAGAKSALDALSKFDNIKILITPGMVELGKEEYKENYEFGKYAAGICDYIILVGKIQTKPIQEGIKSTKFNKKKLFIVNKIEEALQISDQIEIGKKRTVLLENDLPDQYKEE